VGNEFVPVFSALSWVEAEIVKGRLEAEGVTVDVRGEGGEGPYPVGPVELLVPASSEGQARRILQQTQEESDQ
jgi:Putative prokaryotic signal transducing protein